MFDLIKFCNSIVINLSSLSYWICLFVAIICVLLSICGSSKGKKGVSISVVIYTIIQCFLSVLI